MTRKHSFAGVALALAIQRSCEAFTTFPTPVRKGIVRSHCCSSHESLVMTAEPHAPLGRGEFLAQAGAIGAGVAGVGLATLIPKSAAASVQFETERYGDKELKIATVNKLRQQIRNVLLEDPNLAPGMLKLAIADALGYDASTQSGGPDGSVMLEMDREVAKGLKPALEAALKIKKNMQRTNEMTLGDIVAMGGAEAIEAVGGPSITVQLGRYDEKTVPNPTPPIPGFNFEEPTASGVKTAFKRAGLGCREMVLMMGALGSVMDATLALDRNGGNGEDDDLEDLEWQNSIPSTFGKRSDKLGKPLSNVFGPGYLQRVAGAGPSVGAIGEALQSDEEAKNFVRKYAGNSKAFLQDVAEAYTKMTLLGEQYETRSS